MTVVTAVLFLLALCFATTNGWWYVSSYGVPFNNATPRIGGITVSTIFFALFAVSALYTVWLHLRSPQPRERTASRVDDHRGAHPAGGRLHGAGVHGRRWRPAWSASTDVLQRWANLWAFSGGCGLADDVLSNRDTNAGFLSALPGVLRGPLGPWADEAGRFHAQRIAGTHCGRGDPDDQPAAGHRLRLGPARSS